MTDAKPLGRRALAKIRTKERLTIEARAIFRTTPYYKADIRKICEAAGLSTGSFFATWESKEDCWVEVMECPAPIDSALTRAAPAMLAALEMGMEWAERGFDEATHKQIPEGEAALKAMRDAIAKAKEAFPPCVS